MIFLYVFYFLGLLIAIYQDFSRREIDDWLNLFLFFGGVLYLCVMDFFVESGVLLSFSFFSFLILLLSLGFYYFRFFSGGDSKLFFAVSPLIFFSMSNYFLSLAFFIFCLFLGGSFYSLLFSGIIFAKDFKETKKVFIFEMKKPNNKLLSFTGLVFLIVGFFENILWLFSFFLLVFPLLFSMAKTLDKTSMKRRVSTRNLREGDWLFESSRVGKRVFKKDWEGLSEEDLRYLAKFNKQIYIKDGIPYAPSFLIALILFLFRDSFFRILF